MTVSMAIVSAMGVSQTTVSQTISVSQTVSVSESVVSIGLRLSLSISAPLSDVVSVVSVKTLGRPGYERSSVSSMVSNAVSVSVDGSGVSVSVVRISLGTPLANVVTTAPVAGGLDSITKGGWPGRRDTAGTNQGIAMDKASLRGG